MSEKMTKSYRFRVTENEYQEIEKKRKKSKMTKSEYLKKSALENKIYDKEILFEIKKELQNLNTEFRKQGTNINQMARRINTQEIISQQEFEQVRKEYEKLWQSLNLLTQKHLSKLE